MQRQRPFDRGGAGFDLRHREQRVGIAVQPERRARAIEPSVTVPQEGDRPRRPRPEGERLVARGLGSSGSVAPWGQGGEGP